MSLDAGFSDKVNKQDSFRGVEVTELLSNFTSNV